jgi:hypothetical protein
MKITANKKRTGKLIPSIGGKYFCHLGFPVCGLVMGKFFLSSYFSVFRSTLDLSNYYNYFKLLGSSHDLPYLPTPIPECAK